MRTVALGTAIIMLVAGMWLTGGADSAPAAARIGAVAPLTGRYASLGDQVRAGYEFAVENIKFRPDGTGIISSVFVQWQAGKQEMVWPKGSGAVRFLYPAPPWRAR